MGRILANLASPLDVFVLLAIDEDKEALKNSNRIYHTQTLEKAYPGRRD